MPPADEPTSASPRHPMADHAVARIGMHACPPDDPCGAPFHLHLTPLVLEDDGHVDFGVLGVFLDMASSQAVELGPFLHADISINRIAKPAGTKLNATARMLRAGKRTSIVQVDVVDETGVRVADSTQQIVAMKPSPEMEAAMHNGGREAMRRRFMAAMDGECRLDGRLHDIIGIERGTTADGSAVWRMPLGPASRNGFGGLHGGVAFDLVTEAAAGATVDLGVTAQPSGAILRYLDRAIVGPFRAEPVAMRQGDAAAFARVEIYDEGQRDDNGDKLCIVAEVHLANTA